MTDEESTGDDDSERYPDAEAAEDPERAAKRRAHNRQLLRRYIEEVLGEGRMDVVEEIYDGDIEQKARPVKSGRTISGHDEVKEYLRGVRDRFENLDTEVDILVADQQHALAKFTVSGVHADDYFGVDPSEREVTFPVFSKAVVEDGKMVDQGDLLNPLQLQPPAKRYGRSAVLDQIREGILVVDAQDRVVDSNPVAREMLGLGDGEITDEPLDSLFDTTITFPEVGSSLTVNTDGMHLEVSASALTGPDDDRIGRIFLVRDVTDTVRRRQQLEVLNRVLRHNLRNKLNSVIGRTDLIADRAGSDELDSETTEKLAAEAKESAKELVSLGDTARKIEDVVEQADETHALSLTDAALRAVDRGRELYPAATIERDVTEVTVDGPSGLDDIVWELVENALEHTGGSEPWVAVRTEQSDDSGSILVVDEGNGVPTSERSVLDAGRETQLEHASGLGLWFVHLTTTLAGGDLQFESTHPAGNAVRLTFPLAE